MVRISIWNFIRVLNAWLWAHVQYLSLKFSEEVRFLIYTNFERIYWKARETLVKHPPDLWFFCLYSGWPLLGLCTWRDVPILDTTGRNSACRAGPKRTGRLILWKVKRESILWWLWHYRNCHYHFYIIDVFLSICRRWNESSSFVQYIIEASFAREKNQTCIINNNYYSDYGGSNAIQQGFAARISYSL